MFIISFAKARWFFAPVESASYKMAVLMENIEKRMAASDCTDKDKELFALKVLTIWLVKSIMGVG